MMNVWVELCTKTRPGGAWWDQGDERHITFRLSAAGATPEGAAALQRAWACFTRDGRWDVQDNGGTRVTSAVYFSTDALPPSVPVLVDVAPSGAARIALSHLHFRPETVDGIQRAVSDCLDRVTWFYRPRVEGDRPIGVVDEGERAT